MSDAGNASPPAPARRYPASAGQRLLWFMDRYRGREGALNCPMLARVRGPADPALVAGAVAHLAEVHESLRTTFEGGGPRLAGVVHAEPDIPTTHVDLRGAAHPQATAAAALAAEVRSRVEPAAPARATIWRTGDAEHLLCLNLHHLVSDSWSCSVLFRELGPALAHLRGGPPLPAEECGYSAFSRWEEQQQASGGFRVHEEYWRAHLAELRMPPLPLAPGPPLRPGGGAGTRRAVLGELDPDLTGRLRALAGAHHTTVFTVLLAAYYGFLARLTDATDLAVSSLFANRSRPDIQRTTGFLATMLALRTRLAPDATFAEAIAATHRTVLEALTHQAVGYHALSTGRADTRAGADGSPVRVEDVVFQLLAEPIDQTIGAGDLWVEGLVPDVTGRFDLELAVLPAADRYKIKLHYVQERLADAVATELVEGYTALTRRLAARPERALRRFTLAVP